MLTFKEFQLQDYARLALHDGAILGHDMGLGKGIATYAYSFLKCGFRRGTNGPEICGSVLIVAPGDLDLQVAKEGREKFGVEITRINKAKFIELTAHNTRPLPHGFYFASYTDLCQNDVDRLDDWPGLSDEERTAFSREIGVTNKSGIKCVFSPTMADLSNHAFDCVIVDEGVRMKGGPHTLMGRGLLQMNPKYRLVLTATPIKTRLWDIFWLLWWAAGGQAKPHARWPYSSEPGEQDAFAKNFLVTERNLTRERAAAQEPGIKHRRFIRKTAQICSVHLLWKLIAPLVLRRRKEDCGEKLVKKLYHRIHVPMGAEQARVYQYHLSVKREGMAEKAAQLNDLRKVSANPCSTLLHPVADADNAPALPFRSNQPYTPKLATALTLIKDILAKGEQGIVFSTFHDCTDELARHLDVAHVPHLTLDGRSAPKKRAPLAQQIKEQKVPIALAGVDSMAEGHSFPLVNNVIVLAYSWSMDKMLQLVERAHRLDSVRDLNIYILICDRSMDVRQAADFSEKNDAAELVLDGKLISKTVQEMTPDELLAIAEREFDQSTNTIDENALAADWPALKSELEQLSAAWKPTVVRVSVARAASGERTALSVPKIQQPAPARQIAASASVPDDKIIHVQFKNMPYWKRRLLDYKH